MRRPLYYLGIAVLFGAGYFFGRCMFHFLRSHPGVTLGVLLAALAVTLILVSDE